MQFKAIALSDKGNVKQTDEDSVFYKASSYNGMNIAIAIVCDGLGGLSNGELASATTIASINEWYENELYKELDHIDLKVIGELLSLKLKEINTYIASFGRSCSISLGTTFTGILFIDQDYIIVHIGDTRAYVVNNNIQQLTEDQTFVHREISAGRMTPEQVKNHPMKNTLLQCIGASENLEPAIYYGKTIPGYYLLCCDGFRHVVNDEEIKQMVQSLDFNDTQKAIKTLHEFINLIKSRHEADNISAIVVKAGE